MGLTAQEQKEMAALEAELKPKASGLTPAEQKEMVALEAELKPKPVAKRQIPRPDPGLNLFERFAGTVDRGMQTLDRVHSATNAAANDFQRRTEQAWARTPTPEQLQEQGKGLTETVTRPFIENMVGVYDAGKAAIRTGQQAYRENRKEAMKPFSQSAAPDASKAEVLIRRAMDLSFDIQTDPKALAMALGAGAVVKGAGAGLKLAKQIPAVQRGLARANAIVDPLAASVQRSRPGAFVERVLGNFGQGPHQAMRRELIRPHELEVANAARPTQEVLSEVQRETLRLRRLNPQYDTLIQDFGAQNGGANPLEEMLRQTIKERASAGTGRVPFNQLTPKQKLAMVNKYRNPWGISPTWLIEQADKTLASVDATEFQLLKSGVKPGVNRGGSANKAVDMDQWLEGMFGKPAAVRPSTPGALAKPTQVPTQMREAGIRNFVNDLPQHTDWVRPVATHGVADPGWVAIGKEGLLGSKLGGMQVPAPLKAFLDTELAAGGLGVSNEPKSWYIQNKDLIEWVGKNVVGTIKKGLIASTSTQNANLFSNQIVSDLALRRSGIKKPLEPKAIRQAFQDVMAMDKGRQTARDIQEIRGFSNSFDATEKSTSFFGGAPRPAMEGSIIGSGTKFAYREPTVGEAVGALYPPNHMVNFQGTAERAYKLALYRSLKDGGKSPKEAAALVEKFLFDYSDRGPMLEILDKFGIWPFATYPTKALGLLMDTLVHHPEELARYPRLKELAFRGYEQNMAGVDPRYQTAFTFPYGDPKDKQYFDAQRAIPFGAGIEGMNDLAQGQGLAESALSALGLGRAGGSALESVANAPLLSRMYGIAQGISPFSEAGKPKGMLQPGEPASDLGGLQVKEVLRNFAPSQFGGRGTQAAQDVAEGKTPTDYPFSVPKTREDVGLQYGVGVRTFSGKGPTEKKGSPEVKAAVQSRKGPEVKAFLVEARALAKQDRSSRMWQDVKRDADKFTDPGMLKRELGDAKTRARSLPLSGRVVVDGKMTDEGRETIMKQALYLEALIARMGELKEQHKKEMAGGR